MLAEDYLTNEGFRHVGCVLVKKNSDGEPALENPQEGIPPDELHKNLEPPFCVLRFPKLPKEAGAYVIVVAEKVVYVGNAAGGLARRWSQYKRITNSKVRLGGNSTNCKINHRLLEENNNGHAAHLWFKRVVDLERSMIKHFSPPWNESTAA